MTEKEANKQVELDINSLDASVAIGKGLVGALVPLIGAPLAELVGFAIPKQRLDRVVEVLNKVQSDVENLKELIEKSKTPEGSDLVDEAVQQSTRAFSEGRKHYIANMLKNGLTKQEQSHNEKKKLFNLLYQLNDNEVVALHRCSVLDKANMPYDYVGRDEKKEFLIREERNKSTFGESYLNALLYLGLVTIDNKKLHTTDLGNLLLEYIEVPDGTEEADKG